MTTQSLKAIELIVICSNTTGEPDAFLTSIAVTESDYALGLHYEKAVAAAEAAGYQEPFVCVDRNERLFRKLAPMFHLPPVPAEMPWSPDGCAVEQPSSASPGRPFYRTLYQVEVLSQEPVDDDVREAVEQVIQERSGKASFAYMKPGDEELLSGAQMAQALIDMVGSAEHFGLTPDGQDIPGHPDVLDEDEDEESPVI